MDESLFPRKDLFKGGAFSREGLFKGGPLQGKGLWNGGLFWTRSKQTDVATSHTNVLATPATPTLQRFLFIQQVVAEVAK